jgi:hypothetical protein
MNVLPIESKAKPRRNNEDWSHNFCSMRTLILKCRLPVPANRFSMDYLKCDAEMVVIVLPYLTSSLKVEGEMVRTLAR